jgi:hypothetical protein
MRIRAMTERVENKDALEQEFRDLEAKCLECIRTHWKDDSGRGVSIEIEANNDTGLILSLSDDETWTGSSGMEGWEIGIKPPLNDLLDHFALIDEDEGYLFIVQNPLKAGDQKDLREEYLNLERNRQRLGRGLMDAMQNLLDESK